MSLNKAIRSGQERRREYRGSKRFDRTCRNHGSCTYCERNRLVSFRSLLVRAKLEEKLFKDET